MFKENCLFTPLKAYKYNLAETKGTFGVEIELEGEAFPLNVPGGWAIHNDPSLRNGVEYVLTKPHDLSGVKSRMKSLNEVFTESRTRVNKTYRAGVHIHYNVQKESFIHIIGVFILFTILEPIFLKLCGKERDGSYFCLPSYDTGDTSEFFMNLVDLIHGGDWGRWLARGKYANLNTDPVTTFGSIEFRGFPSTYDTETILKYCTWIENMFQLVHTHDDLTFWTMYRMFKNATPEDVSRVFTGCPDLNVLCRPNSFNDTLAFGLEHAYELVRIVSRAMKEEKKEFKKKTSTVTFDTEVELRALRRAAGR